MMWRQVQDVARHRVSFCVGRLGKEIDGLI